MTKYDKFLLESDKWEIILPLLGNIHIKVTHDFNSLTLCQIRKTYAEIIVVEDRSGIKRYIYITRSKRSPESMARHFHYFGIICTPLKEDKRKKAAKVSINIDSPKHKKVKLDDGMLLEKLTELMNTKYLERENLLMKEVGNLRNMVAEGGKAASEREKRLLEKEEVLITEIKNLRQEAQCLKIETNALKEETKALKEETTARGDRLERMQLFSIQQILELNLNFFYNSIPAHTLNYWTTSCQNALNLNPGKDHAMTPMLTKWLQSKGDIKIGKELVEAGVLNSYHSLTKAHILKRKSDNNIYKHLTENEMDLYCEMSHSLLSSSEIYLKTSEDGVVETYQGSKLLRSLKRHQVVRSIYINKIIKKLIDQQLLQVNKLELPTCLERWHFFPILEVSPTTSASNHYTAYLCSLQYDKNRKWIFKSYFFDSLIRYKDDSAPPYILELEDTIRDHNIQVLKKQNIKLTNPQTDNFNCPFYVYIWFEQLLTMEPELWIKHFIDDVPMEIKVQVEGLRNLRQLQLLLIHHNIKDRLSVDNSTFGFKIETTTKKGIIELK
jgi:hypothetical protein